MSEQNVSAPALPTERYLSIARVCDKFSRAKSWLYYTMKNDPTFPKPIRLGTWPVFKESELEAWLVLQAQRPQPAPQERGKFSRKVIV